MQCHPGAPIKRAGAGASSANKRTSNATREVHPAAGASCAESSTSISPNKNGGPTPPKALTNGLSGSEEPLFPRNARLLELQLMHRWSTVTYKSMVTPAAEDDYVWQHKLPVWSLQYDFVLHGLLALTAFEVASSSSAAEKSEQYVHAASQYQDLALGEFRKHLAKQGVRHAPDTSSYEPVLAFSLILMGLALASAQFTHASERDYASSTNMVDNTITHYELVRGCEAILGDQGEEYLASNPYVQKLTRFEDLPRLPVDSPSAAVIAKLNEVNERRLTSTVAEAYEARVQHVKYFEACKKAIGLLQEMEAKCVRDREGYQGYVLGWLNMAGDEYVSAIKDGDQVSLLVLMHWGAIVEKLSEQVWWARRFGGLLVEEIARRVGREGDDDLVRDVVASAIEMAMSAGEQRSR
ncbi:hypothetical protein H2200_007943 [Cladophialophora chaetospira]|uniref:Uncharacterized protein n=1 Tax=Cladophialophora chaetospira TaxID=386627 RepID=A0AA38X6W1_9EURO|nr:hypothetical protein H2200_007943 [Cladophialophora chaetospira]